MDKRHLKLAIIITIMLIFSFLIVTSLWLRFVNQEEVLRDYIRVDENKYLITYYEDYLLYRSSYKGVIVSYIDTQLFYDSVEYSTKCFDIRNYNHISIEDNRIKLITDDNSKLLIERYCKERNLVELKAN